ncbi:MAG TPA: DUF1028 domain-containing protein [Jatrophihabitantaceae bacterium]|jgi:uncharacterized Ntn-hydrolase superfamily protein
MTFSIVARAESDSTGPQWGVAVASKFLAVGAVVPGARTGVGAIATQAYANVAYVPDGLDLLRRGRTAQQVVDELTGADDHRAERQLGVVDASGRAASFTGDECMDWAGGIAGDGVAVQGNILAGPQVVEAMHEAWLATDPAAPLARRLLTALQAGDAAGGDRRGRQSAALYVVTEGGGYGGGNDVYVDVRVDDHPEPCRELARLLDLHHVYFEAPADEALVPLADVQDDVNRWLTALGYPDLDAWVGVENYEMRIVDGKIDRYVLDVLERQAEKQAAEG